MPGPRAETMRPSRKITPRWYSFRILIPLRIKITTIMPNVPAAPSKFHIDSSIDGGENQAASCRANWHALASVKKSLRHIRSKHHLVDSNTVDFHSCQMRSQSRLGTIAGLAMTLFKPVQY